MNRSNQRYAGCLLDRAGRLRKNSAWVAQQFAAPGARILPVWRNRNLISLAENTRQTPTLIYLPRKQAHNILEIARETIFLGLEANIPLFAADISPLPQSESEELARNGKFLDLRRVGPSLAADQAALAAYARSSLRWHRYSRYCGHCGAPSESRDGGHLRVCSNQRCGRESYPRTDPAVIMLVETWPSDGSPPRCLLAHHHRSPPGGYTTLAGFVEPGESLEEAVAREVFEEVGIRLRSVSYQDSQPWPFPASIMLGFRAIAETTELVIDAAEIVDARWYTAEELSGFGEWSDPQATRRLSPKDSIARYLIDSWLHDAASR